MLRIGMVDLSLLRSPKHMGIHCKCDCGAALADLPRWSTCQDFLAQMNLV